MSPQAINVTLYPKMPYDVMRDFVHITLLAAVPNLLEVNPSVPVKTVKELIALAKAKPGSLNYGSAGVGSNNHIFGELFKREAGAKDSGHFFPGIGGILDLLDSLLFNAPIMYLYLRHVLTHP